MVPCAQALFCQVPANHVLNMFDVSNIWHVPLLLEAQGAHQSVCNILKLGGYDNMNLTGAPPRALSPAGQAAPGGSRAEPALHAGWRTTLAERWDGLAIGLKIAMVGKYTGLSDAYLSVLKALQHACLAINRKLEVQWIEASDLEDPGKARSPAPAPPCAARHAARHARGLERPAVPPLAGRGVQGA